MRTGNAAIVYRPCRGVPVRARYRGLTPPATFGQKLRAY